MLSANHGHFRPTPPHFHFPQIFSFWSACRRLPDLVNHFLCEHAFPVATSTQPAKLSTCGHDLGSRLLLGLRVGFTGTPSELVPDDLSQIHYEPGSREITMRTLLSPAHVSCTVLRQWSVLRLLHFVASPGAQGVVNAPAFRALIDVGGLVTGLSNKAVAAALLLLGLDHLEGAVFIGPDNGEQVLVRPEGWSRDRHAGAAPLAPPASLHELIRSPSFDALVQCRTVPLARCGIPRDNLFVFFDQVHSTGTDISLAVDAVAVVTLAKDVTLRDYCQGCYRMRGLGAGQRVHVVAGDEVAQLVRNEMPTERRSPLAHASLEPVDVIAWLVRNSEHCENIQGLALQQQKVALAWREPALSALLSSRISGPQQATASEGNDAADGSLSADSASMWSRFLGASRVSSSGFCATAASICEVNLADAIGLSKALAAVTAAHEVEGGRRGTLDSCLVLPLRGESASGNYAGLASCAELNAGGTFSVPLPALLSASAAVFMQAVDHDVTPEVFSPWTLREQLAGHVTRHLRIVQLNKSAASRSLVIAMLEPSHGGGGSASVLLSRDSEQIQEQTQLQEQARETEEVRSTPIILDPLGIVPWPAAALLLTPFFACTSPRRIGTRELLESYAVPMSALLRAPLPAHEHISPTEDLWVSMNHTRLLPDALAKKLPSRLRNVSVLFTCSVHRTGGSDVGKAPLCAPVSASLLLSLREAESVRLLLDRATRVQPDSNDAVVCELQYAIRVLCPCSDLASDSGKLLSSATLTIPATFWPYSINDVVKGVVFSGHTSPRCLGSLQRSLVTRPLGASVLFQHVALARYFDCQLFPSPTELCALFAAVDGWLPQHQRATVFEALVARRRRDRSALAGTPLAAICLFPARSDWELFELSRAGVAEVLHAVFPSLRVAFSNLAESGGAPTTTPGAVPLQWLIPWLCSSRLVAMLGAVLAPAAAGGATLTDLALGVGLVSPRALEAHLLRTLLPGLLMRLAPGPSKEAVGAEPSSRSVHADSDVPRGDVSLGASPRVLCRDSPNMPFSQFAALFAFQAPSESSNSSAGGPLAARLFVVAKHPHRVVQPVCRTPASGHVAPTEGAQIACDAASLAKQRALLRAYRRAAANKLSMSEIADLGHWVPVAVLSDRRDGGSGGPAPSLSVSADDVLCVGLSAAPEVGAQAFAYKPSVSADEVVVAAPRFVVFPRPSRGADAARVTTYFEVQVLDIANCTATAGETPVCAIGVASPRQLVMGDGLGAVFKLSLFEAAVMPMLPEPCATATSVRSLGAGLGTSNGDVDGAWAVLIPDAVTTSSTPQSLPRLTVAVAVLHSGSNRVTVAARGPAVCLGDAIGVSASVDRCGSVSVVFSIVARGTCVSPLLASRETRCPSLEFASVLLAGLPEIGEGLAPGIALRRGVRVRVQSGALTHAGAWGVEEALAFDDLSLGAAGPAAIREKARPSPMDAILTAHGCPPGTQWLHAAIALQLESAVFSAAGDSAGWIQAASGNAGLQLTPPPVIAAAAKLKQLGARRECPVVASATTAATDAAGASSLGAEGDNEPEATQRGGVLSMVWRVACGPLSRFPSVVLSGCALTSGLWYYEVNVSEPGIGQVRTGRLHAVTLPLHLTTLTAAGGLG